MVPHDSLPVGPGLSLPFASFLSLSFFLLVLLTGHCSSLATTSHGGSRPSQQPEVPTAFSGSIFCPHSPPDCRNESSLDFDVAVILAAMLCALICALGLNTMLHCVVRCTRRAVTEPVEWVQSRRINAGLKKEDVWALPTATYATSSSPASTSGCAICLNDFSDGEKIKVIPECNHRFHVACIDKWLLSNSSCPTCRHRISLDMVT